MERKNVKIVAIGHSSMNMFKTIKEKGIDSYELISICSDHQIWHQSCADITLIIGDDGVRAGGNTAKGKLWAELEKEKIKNIINGAETLILYSCLGGGLGTGALPVVAKIAKEMGLNTHVIVTHPFHFEGEKRIFRAVMGLEETKEFFEDITVINNDDLLNKLEQPTTLRNAFRIIDEMVIKKIQDVIWE